MAAPVRLGRKRPLPICPNPLFVRWLTEWRDEAASRGRRTQFVFQKVGCVPSGLEGGLVLAKPDDRARLDLVPHPLLAPGAALAPALPTALAQWQRS